MKNKLQDPKFLKSLQDMKPDEYLSVLDKFPLKLKFKIMCKMCDNDQIRNVYNTLNDMNETEQIKLLKQNLKRHRRLIVGI